MNDVIAELRKDFHRVWGLIPPPSRDLFFSHHMGEVPNANISMSEIEFLEEQLLGKAYDEFLFDIDDSFGDYLSKAALSYYFGSWLNNIIEYLPSDVGANCNSGGHFLRRLSDLEEFKQLIHFFNMDQMIILIRVCNLYLDYGDVFFTSMNSRGVNKESLSKSVMLMRGEVFDFK